MLRKGGQDLLPALLFFTVFAVFHSVRLYLFTLVLVGTSRIGGIVSNNVLELLVLEKDWVKVHRYFDQSSKFDYCGGNILISKWDAKPVQFLRATIQRHKKQYLFILLQNGKN